MQHKLDTHPDHIVVALSGQLKFTDNSEFRGLLSEIKTQAGKSVVFDLAGLEFMDSAGLGMLLLAKEATDEESARLSLRGANGQVAHLLEISDFGSLISIQ